MDTGKTPHEPSDRAMHAPDDFFDLSKPQVRRSMAFSPWEP